MTLFYNFSKSVYKFSTYSFLLFLLDLVLGLAFVLGLDLVLSLVLLFLVFPIFSSLGKTRVLGFQAYSRAD